MATKGSTEIIQTFARSFKWLRGHPKLTMGGIAGLILALVEGLGNAQTIRGVMVTLFGPNWFEVILASPYFKVAALLVALACLWRIGVLARRGEVEAGKAVEARIQRETLERAKALEIPTMAIRAEAFRRDLDAYEHWIDHMEKAVESQRKMFLATWEKPQAWSHRTTYSHLPNSEEPVPKPKPSNYFETDVEPPIFRKNRPRTDRLPVQYGPTIQYDPEKNEAYLADAETNFRIRGEWVHRHKHALVLARIKLRDFEAHLDERLARYVPSA